MISHISAIRRCGTSSSGHRLTPVAVLCKSCRVHHATPQGQQGAGLQLQPHCHRETHASVEAFRHEALFVARGSAMPAQIVPQPASGPCQNQADGLMDCPRAWPGVAHVHSFDALVAMQDKAWGKTDRRRK